MHLSLLPPKVVSRRATRHQLRRWVAIALVVSLIGLLACGVQYRGLAAVQAAAAKRDRDTAALRQLAAEGARAQGQLAAIRAELLNRENSYTDKQTLSLIGVVGRGVHAAGGEIKLFRLNIRLPQATALPAPRLPAALVTPSTAPVAAPVMEGAVTFDGTAPDAATIAQLIASLRRAGIFSHVELKGSTEEVSTAGTTRLFQVEGRF